MQFERIKAAEADLERIDARLREKLAPYAEPLGRLMRIPGVNWITATTIIAEIGVYMGAFVSAAHLASWTGICPGNHQSAGKQKTGKVRKGNVHLKTALVTAAVAVAKTRGSYLGDKHRRLRARRGDMRAHVAIAHKILVAAYISWPRDRTIRTWGQTTSTRSINGVRRDNSPVVCGTWVTRSISGRKPPDGLESTLAAITSFSISMVEKRSGAGMDRSSNVTLTKTVVNNAEVRSERYHIRDAESAGFGLRVEASGAKTFVVRYVRRPAPGVRSNGASGRGDRTVVLGSFRDEVHGGGPAGRNRRRAEPCALCHA
jgi:hypothetical protein